MDKINEIAMVLGTVDDVDIISDFLRSLLTSSEMEAISSRWELVKLLDRGVSQRKISALLGLSLCKITRGSKELKKTPSSFAAMLQKYRELDGNTTKATHTC